MLSYFFPLFYGLMSRESLVAYYIDAELSMRLGARVKSLLARAHFSYISVGRGNFAKSRKT